MARLPSAQSLGPRPTPDSRRALGTINPGAAASIGRAAAGFGNDLLVTGARIGQVNEERAREQDATAAFSAYTSASEKVRSLTLDPEKGLYARRGGQAIGAYEEADKSLKQIYDSTLSSLSTDGQRRAFDAMWARRRETELNSVARHEQQQREVYRDQTVDALVQNAVLDATANYNNPEAIRQSLEVAQASILVNTKGLPPDMVNLRMAAARSAIHSGIVERMMEQSALEAQSYLQAHRDEIDGLTIAKLEKTLSGGVKKETAQRFAKDIGTGAPIAAAGAIASEAAAQGVDPVVALTVAQLENASGDPNARPIGSDGKPMSSAHGLFQVTDGTWAARGGSPEDRGKPEKQIQIGVKNLAEEAAALEKTLGRKPEGWEIYIGHQQGAGGAKKILTGDAGANAVETLGRAEVLNNGGSADMTVGQFRDVWKAKYERAAARVKVPTADIQDRALQANLTLADKLDAANTIGDDDTRRLAVAYITEGHGRIQAAANARERGIREQAWQALEENPSLEAIPASVWGNLDLRDQTIIENYIKKRAKGEAIETDLAAYDRLNIMAGANPDEFAKVDLNQYRDKLSENDWQRMSDLRRTILAGGRKGTDASTAVRNANQMTDDALRAIDIDPTPKEGTEAAKTAALFRRRVQENIEALEAQKGSKATPAEIQGVIDWQIMRGRSSENTGLFGTGLFAGKQRAFEVKPGETFTVTDIETVPPEEVTKITEALKRAGREPNDELVLELFNRKLGGARQ